MKERIIRLWLHFLHFRNLSIKLLLYHREYHFHQPFPNPPTYSTASILGTPAQIYLATNYVGGFVALQLQEKDSELVSCKLWKGNKDNPKSLLINHKGSHQKQGKATVTEAGWDNALSNDIKLKNVFIGNSSKTPKDLSILKYFWSESNKMRRVCKV